ncbi:MAG: DUF4249 domain-containing protein, partial [Calditrichia bacterium]|nr:DUF4249 domain-containing protein [Calditrichia bacterium]
MLIHTYKKQGLILLYFAILIALFSINCDTPSGIDLPEHQHQLVANCFFNPDSNWAVNVSHSVGAFENAETQTINNAEVEIWNNNQLVDTLQNNGNGEFMSTTNKPVSGKEYTLKISAPGYNNIWAVDKTPLPVNIDSLNTIIEIDTGEFGYTEADINIYLSFTDPASIQNYYNISVYVSSNYYSNVQQWISTSEPVILETVRENYNIDPGVSYLNREFSFSDIYFPGKAKTFLISSIYSLSIYEDETISEVAVVLRSISKSY